MSERRMIRIGIGGWTYDPWYSTFYPADIRKGGELEYASRHVTAIEVNSTFYRNMSPSVFAKWKAQTPDTFMFSIKAPRAVVQRKSLGETGESIERFLNSGITELEDKLGPILWQLPPSKRYDHQEMVSFLAMLPPSQAGIGLRHAIEVRHESFASKPFLDLARSHDTTCVFGDDKKFPSFSDATGSFIYARLRNAESSIATGYSQKDIEQWMRRAEEWSQGETPQDLFLIEPEPHRASPRDVFIFFINGAKERAPAAALYALSVKR